MHLLESLIQMKSNATDTVDLHGTIEAQTAKAILFSFELEDETYKEWFPFSAVNQIHETSTKGSDKLNVDKWILKKKGIEI